MVITMPAYRAEGTLEKTFSDIPDGVADLVIVVDDASSDKTADVARELGIRVFVHPENRGYGGNQKTCYAKALEEGADVVVLLHPDYQYDPKAVPLLIAPILAGHADMTFGSRFAGSSDPLSGGMPLYRFLGNRIVTSLENVMLGSRFTEMHSGLRAYTRDCLLSLPFLRYTDDFSFDSQLLIDALTGGQRVVELPIPTRYTSESSSISVGRSLRYVGHSLSYCARRAAVRGRRGRRSPVANFPSSSRRPAHGPAVRRRCVACGGEEQLVLYPTNVSDEASASEYSCTSGALARYDDILQCVRCGMVSSKPALAPPEILDRYANVADRTYLKEEEGRRELFDWVLDVMSGYFVRGRRLLEIGSHVGLFLDSARAAGWDPHGIEPSRWAVEVGRERFGVDLEEGTLEELVEQPEETDAVVLLDVLEHLVDPLGALSRLRSLMSEDGILVVSTINFAGLHARLRGPNWPWLIRPHLHYFTPGTLRSLFEAAGFELVEWALVPRSFHLSYVASRGASNLGLLGRSSARLAEVADVKVPLGWLGDVVLLVGRPSRASTFAPEDSLAVRSGGTFSDQSPLGEQGTPLPAEHEEAGSDERQDVERVHD